MIKNIWYLTLASILVSPPILAQELEEIIVSAQRREESLQDVPVSITAFSSAQLEQQNITEAKDYLQMTPNVNFTEDGEVGQRAVGISMRGVSDFANTFTGVGGLSNSFGIYLDEFNIANNSTKTANPQLQDVDRLEILRGPQGTYFGRNATGGALNLSTKLPNDEIEYELGAGFSRFNTWEASTVVNFPITDSFFIRAVTFYEESDGFLTNLSPTGNDDSYDHLNFRIAGRWLVNDRVTADLSVMRTVENDGTDSNINTGVSDFDTPNSTPNIIQVDPGVPDVFDLFSNVFPVDSGGGFYPANRDTIAKDFEESNRNEATIVNLRLNYEGENWTLRSVTGLLDSESQRQFDQDLTQYSLYETYSGRTGDTFSEELRLNFQRDNWDLTVGALYATDEAITYSVSPIGSAGFFFLFDAANDLLPDGTLVADFLNRCFCLSEGGIIDGPRVDKFEADSWAVFAEMNYKLTDNLKLTVGIRYTDDEIEVREADLTRVPFDQQPLDEYRNFQQPAANDPRVTRFDIGRTSSSGFTPRFVLNWAVNDELTTYATASNGYKPGGLTFQDTGLPTGALTIPFDEESLWNYEVGAKWRSQNGRLQVNSAAFFMDWEDLQIPSVEIAIVNNVIVNNFRITNTEAESLGFEIEAQALLTNNFHVGGGAGYLNAEFTSFGADSPFVINNNGFDLDGVTLPRSPEWTVNLFGQYNFEIGGMDSWVRLDWSYRSETTADIEATVSQLEIQDTAVTQALGLDTLFNGTGFGNGIPFPWPRGKFPSLVPSYDVTNLRAGISGERWAVTVYVENLFDDNFYTGTQENFGIGGFRLRPHFRTAGIHFRLFSN